MRIKIVRHSERLDCTYPYIWIFYLGYYWFDTPLTTNGCKMAKEKGKEFADNNFSPKCIYTSPYIRTYQTATEISSIFPGTEIKVEPLLAEYQPTFKHRITIYPEGIPCIFNGKQTEYSFPETYEKHVERVKFIIENLIANHGDNDDILIITHAEVIRTYLQHHLAIVCPDTIINGNVINYLTTLTFQFDKKTNNIIDNSIHIE